MDKAPQDIVDRGKKTTVIEVEVDWCDACSGSGAQVKAYVFAELPSGRTVCYCASHGTRYWDALNAQARFVVDMRDTVLAISDTP